MPSPTFETTTRNSYPSAEERRKARLHLELNKAVRTGNRFEAGRIKGELMDLKPVELPEGAPRLWQASKSRYGSPYDRFNGRNVHFMEGEVDRNIQRANERGISPAKFLLDRAGVDLDQGDVGHYASGSDAAEVFKAARLAKEVGTYHIDNGGIAFRDARGDLNCLRESSNPEIANATISALKAAGYVPGELPLIITNNGSMNQLAFADQQR